MTDAARLRRMARAQRAVADVAAATHVIAVRAHLESEAQADLILAALGAETPLHGLVVPTMAEALKRNGRMTELLRREAEVAASARWRAERTAASLDERARDAANAEAASHNRREMEELAMTWQRRRCGGAASLRPATAATLPDSADIGPPIAPAG